MAAQGQLQAGLLLLGAQGPQLQLGKAAQLLCTRSSPGLTGGEVWRVRERRSAKEKGEVWRVAGERPVGGKVEVLVQGTKLRHIRCYPNSQQGH